MTITVSEKELSGRFETLLLNHELPQFPPFAHAVPELSYERGRADLVCSAIGVDRLQQSNIELLVLALATVTDARVLSLLNYHKFIPEHDLEKLSGFTRKTVRKSVSKLIDLGMIEDVGQRNLTLLPSMLEVKWEFWAFELKLQDWKRALYQSLNSKTFAQNTTVVLSKKWVHRAQNEIDLFIKLKVGLASLDSETGEFDLIVAPRRRKPVSTYFYYYALGKFLQRVLTSAGSKQDSKHEFEESPPIKGSKY
jgi:hypothetical protein